MQCDGTYWNGTANLDGGTVPVRYHEHSFDSKHIFILFYRILNENGVNKTLEF